MWQTKRIMQLRGCTFEGAARLRSQWWLVIVVLIKAFNGCQEPSAGSTRFNRQLVRFRVVGVLCSSSTRNARARDHIKVHVDRRYLRYDTIEIDENNFHRQEDVGNLPTRWHSCTLSEWPYGANLRRHVKNATSSSRSIGSSLVMYA